MIYRFTYIVILTAIYVVAPAQPKEYWYPVPLQDLRVTTIIGDDSEDNLWLLSDQQTLVKSTPEGEIIEFPIPQKENSTVKGLVTKDGTIYLSYIDVDYRSTFYRGKPEKGWIQFQDEIPNAMRQFFRTEDGVVYAYGDWGNLITFDAEKNTFQQIPFPYEQHITSAKEINGRIFLGVRNIGLVELASGETKVFNGSENIISDINAIYHDTTGNPPAFLTMRGRYIEWNGAQYEVKQIAPINRSSAKGIFLGNGAPVIAGLYSQVFTFRQNSWSVSNIPANNDIVDFFKSRKDVLYVLDSHGLLYELRSSGELLFTNYTRLENMFGQSFQQPRNFQTIDVNNDGLADITFTNTGINKRINIFIQYEEGVYREESARFFNEYPSEIEHVWFQDFSSDGKTDLLIMFNKDSNFYIQTYLQFQKKFIPHQTLTIHSDIVQDLRDFTLADVDQDGDLDVLLGFYYGNGRKKGAVVILENNQWGYFTLRDELNSIYRNWSQSILFGDVNADGNNETIIGNFWRPDVIISGNINEPDQKLYEFPDSSNTTEILLADINRDGSAELIRVSWEFGLQIFDISMNFQFTELQKFYQSRTENVESIAVADINADGWPDVLVSGEMEGVRFSHFLLNNKGILEQLSATDFGITLTNRQKLIPVDFDQDGDYDIISLGERGNIVYENQRNPQRVLRFLIGNGRIPSNQWRIIQDDSVLFAHKNTISGMGYGNSELITGLQTLQNIRIENGDNLDLTYTLSERDWGSQIIVSADNPFWLRAVFAVKSIHVVFHAPSFYYYIITIAFGTMILMLTYYLGAKKLGWEGKSLVIITFANSTLFWVLLVLSNNLMEYWRFGIPLIGVVAGSVLPVIFSLQNRLFHVSQNKEDIKMQILDLMLRFTHGAWSNSVINRFKMLLLNISGEDDEEMMAQLQDRKTSFLKIVLPELKKIHKLVIEVEYNSAHVQMLGELITYFDEKLKTSEESLNRNADKISKKLEELRGVIKLLRNETWQYYSCNLVEVVQQVTDLHMDTFQELKITIDRRTDGSKEAWVLTPPARMAEIIDNIILNAVHAMKKSSSPKMNFHIYYKAPKWVLEIGDSGSGIRKKQLGKIFESGYSDHDSSGQGLYKSKESLKQFGGRITVKETETGVGTTFKIECLEGVAP